MIKEQTAYGAIRALSVDIANLTARIALSNATVEVVMALKEQIDRGQWIGHDNGDDPATVTLPIAEVEKVVQLLDALDGFG
jgi:hypothetical protein